MRRQRVAFAAVAVLLSAFLLAACSAGGQAVSVPVRDAVNDYSWAELASIADEIAGEGSDEGALAVAQRYHLVGEDRRLDGNQLKDVELADGTVARVTIAGFNQDVTADGEQAGITFAFVDAVDSRPMNNNAGFDALEEDDDPSALGGWPASEARAWLNSEFADQLPRDLQDELAQVEKRSCVVPYLELSGGVSDQGTMDAVSDSLMQTSVDRLWLPSVSEVSGVSDTSAAADDFPTWVDVLRAEGTQYQLFADAGVAEEEPSEVLVRSAADGSADELAIGAASGAAIGAPSGSAADRAGDSASSQAGDGLSAPCAWRLRSLEYNTFSVVQADGALDRSVVVPGGADLGIAPCFAL